MTEHLLIVGAGQAATQAVHTLRQNGYSGRITIVGGERHPPYQRPPLSKKYLAGELARERLELRPAVWYRERDVTLELGTRAVELEPAARRVRLDDGRIVDYDRLILATGSKARRLAVPGAELAGIHYLRTIDDVDAIAPELVPGRRLVLVGAGYIGLEVASVAVRRGLDVTVLEAADRVMSRVVGPAISAFYERYHRDAGVNIECGTVVSGFVGRERVEAVETSGGLRFACDVVIVGIGVDPDVELARSGGLPCDNGIVVDERGRTADPLIVAAGDCTNHPHPLAASRVRLESVQNAIEQAKAAASNFAGEPHAYAEVPWFWSDQYDLKLQIAGLAEGYDETIVRGDPAQKSFAVYHLRGGELAAVEAVNAPRDFMFARKAIAARISPRADQIADPAFDLAKLLPA
ncbi:MAG: FAD-dependent oxidoreductase [Gammaproteobacteria bacterium]|nr:pyridine nucleotide-disulfide oxidoreductase [Gammaproteobacteria bacterium]